MPPPRLAPELDRAFAMAEAVGISHEQMLRQSIIAGEETAQLIEQCHACSHEGECRLWLGLEAELPRPAPDFCPNQTRWRGLVPPPGR